MCGIAGLYRPRRPFAIGESTGLVQAMTDSLAHRGPDAQGQWSDPQGRCIFGHRRLSIIDTSQAGLQPFLSNDGRLVITFNGEIYNYRELKPLLENAGVRLRGRTDTEILIEALGLWGLAALEKLDGMYAFATFDTQTGELLLARDPFGEKPLYWMDLPDGGLAFASELQALERLPGFDGTVDLAAAGEVLCFQYIGAPRSIYRQVRKLRPGHWMRRSAAGEETNGSFFAFRPAEGRTDPSLPELADELEDILVRSLRRRIRTDVPLGAFLSGGIDTSTACALLRRKLDIPLRTYSIGFKDTRESEHLTARAFARHLRTDHHELIIEPRAADFLSGLGRMLDEPNADSSCLPTHYLCGFARRGVTVAIGGDGGDEMFGGYRRYFATLDEQQRHGEGRLPAWRPGAAHYGRRLLIAQEAQIRELFGFVPPELDDHLSRLRADVDASQDDLLAAMRRTDVENYLPGAVLAKVDRMSMRHALEVRTPYLSVELARFVEALPSSALARRDHGKLILREIAARYLPHRLVNLPKQGFGLPMTDWARNELLEVAAAMLAADDARLPAALGRESVLRFMEWRTPQAASLPRLWSIIMLESWLRHHPAIFPDVARERGAVKPVSNGATPAAGATRDTAGPSIAVIMDRAAAIGLARFAFDGPDAGEYLAQPPGKPRVYRHTGRPVSNIVLPNGRARIKVPFRLMGHLVCSEPEHLLGMFWCLDLLKSGYLFVHLSSPSGLKKVSLVGQLLSNCLARLGARTG
jgi:asparagine synthase (glutamine-hydrolysing)